MDFLSKFLQRKPPRSGGGSPAASSTPTVPVKPDHEAHVQFAREFVVELVETVPKKSEKAALAKVADKEDIVSLKSVSPSNGSFQSINSVTENTSLPDLLQPESVYKKQTDTDTDTTEYESAAETDPLDAASPIENLVAEDILTDFHEAVDKKQSPAEEQKPISDNSLPETSDPSPLSDAYEDVGDTTVKTGGEDEVKSLDISGLCLFVSNLCLDSPKRSEDSESTEYQEDSLNNNSDVVNNSVVTEQSFASISDSTFVVEDKCAKVNENLGDSPSECGEIKAATEINCNISSTNLPENTCVSPERIQELSSLESTVSRTAFEKQEAGKIHEIIPEVTSAEVLSVESPVIKQVEVLSENAHGVPEISPVEFSKVIGTEVTSDSTPEVTSEKFPEELPLISADIKQIEVSENIPEVTSKLPEALIVKSPEESLEKTVEVSSVKATEESKTHDLVPVKLVELTSIVQEILQTKSDQIPCEENLEVAAKVSDVSSVKPKEVSQENNFEGKSNEISELVDSLLKQTELSSTENNEKLPVNLLETSVKSTEVILKNLEVLERSVEIPSVIPTEVLEGNFKVSQVELTETKPVTLEISPEVFPTELEVAVAKSPELSPKTPTGEALTSTGSSGESSIKQIEESEETSEVSVVKVTEGTKVVRQEDQVVAESVPVQTLKSQETETEADTVDTAQEWTSETDICSSESIPVEETPSVTSVTNSIEEKLLESKDFSTSFEVLSTDKEVPSELLEDKIQTETVEPNKESSQKWSPVKFINLSATLGIGDYKLQKAEKEVEVEKKEPAVLTELFEICNRQQKDLDLGDEKFVDGREFFDPPSSLTNLSETVVVSTSQPDLSKTVTGENYGEFDDSIAEEAEKIYQEILNVSSHLNDCSVNPSDITIQHISKMADVQRGSSSATAVVDDGMNPFVTQSTLRRSPPLSAKASPRSSSQGASPADSPRTRSKLSSVNQARDNSLSRDGTGDASPRSRSGKNSPDRRISSNRVSSLEGSPKNSIISSEINQSEAGPDIADDAHVHGGDVFKDPSTFDFLNSVGNSNIVTDLRKESLYVKFDPLVGAARTIDQSVPLPQAFEAKSNNIGPSGSSTPHESFSNNITPPRNVAISVVDKLISLSPSPRKKQVESPVKQVVTPVSSPIKENYPDNSSMIEELYLLREILAKQDEKHREEVSMQQQKLDYLQAQLKEYEEREARLNKKVVEKSQGQKQMSIIMEEYEKTISRLVAEKEQERQAHELDRASLLKERDTAMGHLANIEIAFSDLHKKYERSKTVIEGFKKNEEVLRSSLAEYEATIRKQEQKYDVLKSHAMAQLENANQELDSVKRSQQAEAAKLKAMLKKAEVKTSSLEEMLEQKVKENQELASICDELINKVGSSE